NHVAYNGYGSLAYINSSLPFSFLSAYVTAGWYDNLRLEAKGYNGTNLVYDNVYTLSATNPTHINFNYVGVTSIAFSSSGGSPHQGYGGLGTHFVLDNVAIVAAPTPPLTTLFDFSGFDGASPDNGVTLGPDGNYYGTASYGGTYGYGTLFRITPNGNLTTAASFGFGSSGSYPRGALILASDNNLYGVTSSGGQNGSGTIYKFNTNGSLTTLLSFNSSSGGHPQAGLMQASDGALYGTTTSSGLNGYGSVYRATT